MKFSVFDTAPPGFCTFTGKVPTVFTMLPGIAAVIFLSVTKVTAKLVPSNVAEMPGKKPVPLSVIVNVVPRKVELGANDVRVLTSLNLMG